MPLALYHSPWDLLPFQADGVARTYLEKRNVAVWSCGIGKTHLGMAEAALLFEDGLIDLCLVVCEKNKVVEWMEDFAKFTDLSAVRYWNVTPARRAQIRECLPQVMVSTYETVRDDAASFDKKHPRRQPESGPLTQALLGKRVLIVYDEATRLRGRSSKLHRAHRHLVDTLDGYAEARVLGLTATPIERGPDDFYNLLRIVAPDYVPTVDEFTARYTRGYDFYGNYIGFKNLSRDDCAEGITPFADLIAPVVMRKRKSDPDVRDQFPAQVEDFQHIVLESNQLDFYAEVQKLDVSERDEGTKFGLLRQIAGHPLSLTRQHGKIATEIVSMVGQRGLLKIGSAKLDRLMIDLTNICDYENAQCIVWTFFGQSVLPFIHEATRERWRVSINHGGMTNAQRERSKDAFKAGDTNVFLTSDAGARGINLPNASYSIQYDLPLMFSIYMQRMDRNHRIDSTHDVVTNLSYIALDTIEEGVAKLIVKRNRYNDKVVDADLDEGDGGGTNIDASLRRRLIAISKKNHITDQEIAA